MIKHAYNGQMWVFVAVIVLSGCSKQSDILTPTEPESPTHFRVDSVGNGKAFLNWAASPDSGSSGFVGYRIVSRTTSGLVIESTNTASTASSHIVAGIKAGSYAFSIQSVKSNGSSSQKIVTQWERKAHGEFHGSYKYKSSGPSDIEFLTGQRFDFTIANNTVRTFQQKWRHTQFVETAALSFDDSVVIPDISQFCSTPGLPIVSGKIYFATTKNGRYAKFRVEPPGVQVDPTHNRGFVNITVAYGIGNNRWTKPSTTTSER